MSARAVALAALATLAAAAGCGAPSTRDVRVTIVDEAGMPVPGAVFWAEAYDEKGGFAFVTGIAGDAGEVPDSAREPLKLPWRDGARVALAAFAPGYWPAVIRDPDERVESDGALLVLTSREEEPPEGPDPTVLSVEKLAKPGDRALREAFRAALEE